MKELASGVWHLNTIAIPNSVNAFLVEDVLVDAGTRRSTRKILRQLDGHRVDAHALTHAHPDHQGASHELCERLGVPFWVGAADVDAAENPQLIAERQPSHPMAQLSHRLFTGPGHPVDRALRDGDEVAGFRVIETPGHSAGHLAFWRESDRVLIAGDVVNTANPLTGIPGLRLPYDFWTPDPQQNRDSAKRLGELEPALVLAGHGPPLRDGRKFTEFCAAL